VSLPITIDGKAKVIYDLANQTDPVIVRGIPHDDNILGSPLVAGSDISDPATIKLKLSNGSNVGLDPNGSLYADLSKGLNVDANINDVRTAFQLQKWMERSARAGSRYVEQILAFFGVRSSDARLQRPEYLGGGRSPVVISEVLQTSHTIDDVSPQGNMAGHGISAAPQNGCKYKVEEHGYIIGIMSVMPRTAYQDGTPRHFFRNNRYDFYWPTFAHLGEQPVFNKEIYQNYLYDGDDPDNLDTFGYQSRYCEYKYIPSSVHGDFRENLDIWHMGRKFNSRPYLNKNFVTADPTKRVFAVTDLTQDELWVQCYNQVKAVRPMPRFGEPGLIDHF